MQVLTLESVAFFVCRISKVEHSLFINMHIFRKKRRKKRCFTSSEFTRCVRRLECCKQFITWSFHRIYFIDFVKLKRMKKKKTVGINKNFNYFMPFELVHAYVERISNRFYILCNIMNWLRIQQNLLAYVLVCHCFFLCESDSNCFNRSNVDNFFTHKEREKRSRGGIFESLCFFFLYNIAYTVPKYVKKKRRQIGRVHNLHADLVIPYFLVARICIYTMGTDTIS